MQITIRHIIEFARGSCPFATLADLRSLEAHLMSALSDKIAEANASADDAIARVKDDVADLERQIADLQAQVNSGGATQADLDALDSLKAKLAGIDPTKPSVLPGA